MEVAAGVDIEEAVLLQMLVDPVEGEVALVDMEAEEVAEAALGLLTTTH